MKYWPTILLILVFIAVPAVADDKAPRDDKDKKETPQKQPESNLDKTKDRLKEKGEKKNKHNSNSDEDSDFFMGVVNIFVDYYPENLRYSYAPYPYFEEGMFRQGSASNRPVYLESALSGFTGFNHMKAVSANVKMKFFTFAGIEYNFAKLNEKTRYYDSDMKIHRVAGVLNLLTHTYGILETKFGYTRIIDVGGGPTFGLELTLAPVKPLIFRGNIQLSTINNNQVGDYYLGTGFAAGAVEIFGGYRVFTFPGTNINGPTGGLILRF
jgi:hypothetical protein